MSKFIMSIVLLIIMSQMSFAVFHDFGLQAEEKKIAYLYLSQINYSTPSGALNYETGIGDGRTGEISVFAYRKWYLIPDDNTVQLSILGKQKLLQFSSVSFSGVIGLGVLYSSSLGSLFSPNVGGILGWDISPGLKLAFPLVASIYSDPGMLLDYSLGISYAPVQFKGKNLLLGFKGTLMAVADPNAMAFGNTFYYYAGLRVDL